MPLLALISFALARASSFDATADWSAVSSAIRSRYYARVTNKEKMDRLLAEYEPKAKGARSLTQFEDVVNQMIHDFGDSHFALLTRSDQGYYMMDGLLLSFSGKSGLEMPTFGAWIKSTPDGFAVQMVIDGTSAQRAGLRKGDVLLRINGQPFSPIDSLATLVGSTAKVELKRGAESLTKSVDVTRQPALDVFLQGSSDSSRIMPSGTKKYGYFHLWTQASAKFQSELASAVYGRLKDTDAFILDLRDGFGGRPEGYADPFFRPESSVDYGGGSQLFGYQRPLVVLINKGSRSAKEVLSFILKKSKRAVLIGSNTAGDVLGTFPLKLGDWGYLEIPMVDVKVDGQRLEKVGVAPDIEVPAEFDSNGKDLVLERAIRYLDEHPKRD